MSSPPDLFAGRYELEGALGRGTFGTVQRAFDTRLKRFVAIKMPHRLLALDEDFLHSFTDEAQTAAALNHPNIVTIYDVGETDEGLPYLAMRFLEGRSLRQLLIDEDKIPLERGLHILDQLAGALDYLQDHRLVHRDIKPANVMVDQHDTATLMDFGLARVLSGTHLSLSGMLAFTPLYASPEQAAGERLTPASDRYSFAVVAYETLTGKTPHADYDSQLLLHAIRFEPPPPPNEINRELTPAAGRVLLSALSKDPAARPPSAQSIVRDLRMALIQRSTVAPFRDAIPRAEPPESRPAPLGLDLPTAPERSPEPLIEQPPRPSRSPSSPTASQGSSAEPATPAAPAETVIRPGWQPAAPGRLQPPPEPSIADLTQRPPLPVRLPSELAGYAAAGVTRVEVFGRSPRVCPTCAATRSHTYALNEAPRLPLHGCTSVWGCHCEYAPILEAQQALHDNLLVVMNPGQRSRLELQRLRRLCDRGEAKQIEIVVEPNACDACRSAAHAYHPHEVPTLPLFTCRRYPPCDAHYQLVQSSFPMTASLTETIRRLDASLKRKGWPWQWH